MATGGTGDTLAGIIAGFLAQFKPTIETIAGAVYLHSLIEMIWPKPTMLFYQRRLVKPCRHI